jgi:hypothetical protein
VRDGVGYRCRPEHRSEAAQLRAFLVKLSGRQMKHNKDFTHAALLAGLWVWLSMLEVMHAGIHPL